MVATSAQSATVAVSAGTSIFFGGEDNSNGGNGWSMTDQVSFNASGEMDNGFTISTHLQIDSGAESSAGSHFDDRNLVIDTGDMGKITYSGHGSSGPVGAWDDLTPTANEEAHGTSIGGTADGPTNSDIGTDSFIYDYTVSDGIALKAAYKPSKSGGLESSTEFGVQYTGMAGLTISAAMGENNAAADKVDLTVFSANYTTGPMSFGIQVNETDHGTASSDEDFTAYGVSYALTDDVSLSYGVSTIDYADATKEDQESSAVSASFTAGGVAISGSYQVTDNVDGTGANNEDFTAYGVSYAVSDDVSVSYNVSTIDYASATKEDQDSSAVSVSFTAGGVAISGSYQQTDNVAGTTTMDNTGYEINFSFAF
jgi:outer membrane protein OmpU